MWNHKDTLVVLLVAAATAAISLAVLSPSSAIATDGGTRPPEVSDPKLVTDDGLVIRLKTDKPVYAAGDKPNLALTVENTGKEQMEASVEVNIFAIEESNMMSRRGPVPRSLWKKECKVSVASGKTETVAIATDCALPAGNEIRIVANYGKQGFIAFKTTIAKDESSEKKQNDVGA